MFQQETYHFRRRAAHAYALSLEAADTTGTATITDAGKAGLRQTV